MKHKNNNLYQQTSSLLKYYDKRVSCKCYFPRIYRILYTVEALCDVSSSWAIAAAQ